MRRDLRDKPDGTPREYPRDDRIHQLEEKAYRYGLELADRRLEVADLATENYRLEQEVEKLRAENVILKEEIRLREVASWKGRGLGGKKQPVYPSDDENWFKGKVKG